MADARDQNQNDPAPEWASFFSSAERWDAFDSAVRAYFKSRGEKVMISDGAVKLLSAAKGQGVYGLQNLAQACAMLPQEQWGELIGRHFALALDSSTGAKAMEPTDFASVRDNLCVRLWAQDVSDIREMGVWREDVPGLLSVLTMDTETAVRTVPRSEVDSWGLSDDEVFAAAISNIERLAPVSPRPIDLGEGQTIYDVSGDSFFTSSWALRIDELEELHGEHGVFFAVPTRHVLLAIPFRDMGSLKAIASLMQGATGFHRDGPGSICPWVYWRKDGRTFAMPYEIDGDRMSVSPPEEFAEYLNGLHGGDDQP